LGKEMMQPSIFIVGTQRSGTTLLCRMLTAHPNIFIKNEFSDPCRIFSGNKSKHEIINDIDVEIQNAYHENLKSFLKRIDKKIWGLKDPKLTYCLDDLANHFPNAKFLFIIRDGRAVANSYIKSKWGSGTNTYHGALRWKREVELHRMFIQKNLKICHVVRYEDLIRNTEEELIEICSFIGQSYSENMKNYSEQPVYIKKNELNKHTFHSIDESIMSKWQTELTPYQISVFEAVAGETLLQNQYDLVGEKIAISAVMKMWFSLQQKMLGNVQLHYQLKSQILKRFIQKLLGRAGIRAD
jgi:sulfotransferase family protein